MLRTQYLKFDIFFSLVRIMETKHCTLYAKNEKAMDVMGTNSIEISVFLITDSFYAY